MVLLKCHTYIQNRMMNKEQFRELVNKISDGKATKEEVRLYNRYYNSLQSDDNEAWNETELGPAIDIDKELRSKLSAYLTPRKTSLLLKFPYWSVAATIVVALGFTFLNYRSSLYTANTKATINDIAPGGNKAILTLADGTKVRLTDSAAANVEQSAGIVIKNTQEGQLIYSVVDSKAAKLAAQNPGNFNILTTPIGGQYRIELPDGTNVWLNASSAIKFPTSFYGLKHRNVELLSGEAYFEVKHDHTKPFIVKTGKQRLLVLGTHFNINSYSDQTSIKTTLLQGSVLVEGISDEQIPTIDRQSVILKPGQQSTFGVPIKVADVDVEMITAWKEGVFIFNDTELSDILKQLSRWYGVEVGFENIPQGKYFNGIISRSEKLSKVLALLEMTSEIKFNVVNNKITLTNLK